MPFLPPNQQRQSTEDKLFLLPKYNSNSYELKQQCSIRCDALLWLKTGLNSKLKITQQQKTREKFPVINITSAGVVSLSRSRPGPQYNSCSCPLQ